MSTPKAQDVLNAIRNAKGLIDPLFAKLEANANDPVLQADLVAAQAALDAALDGADLGGIVSSVSAVVEALKSGKSEQGGGFNATLA